MENTMIVGDHFLVQEFPKPRLSKGDLVVFHLPVDSRQTFIKRVIGVPGDHIGIASRTVYRNGSILPESYVLHKLAEENRWRDNFPPNPSEPPPGLDDKSVAAVQEMLRRNVLRGELIVPPGKYFVLGDNRDNSLDSRYRLMKFL